MWLRGVNAAELEVEQHFVRGLDGLGLKEMRRTASNQRHRFFVATCRAHHDKKSGLVIRASTAILYDYFRSDGTLTACGRQRQPTVVSRLCSLV